MLIRNAGVLLGDDLAYVPSTSVLVSGGRVSAIGPDAGSGRDGIDAGGLLLIPGLVNCHTHVGDSIAKDVALGTTTSGRVHPVYGAKAGVLAGTSDEHLVQFMAASCRDMVRRGITTIVDFREGGARGAKLLRRAAGMAGIRCVILGRISSYHGAEQVRGDRGLGRREDAELEEVLGCSDGLGISGAGEYSDAALRRYSRARGLRAIHAAETEESVRASRDATGRGEVERALLMRPHFVVHMTRASPGEVGMVAEGARGIVVCPRSNGALAGGIPDIAGMLGRGCVVALGTDNVMVNLPDMFREMDYAWKVSMGRGGARIDPAEILKMATVNASRILRRDVGVIREGAPADIVFIEKHALGVEPMHNPHASVVHRVSESAIRAVMIGGRVVHGRL